MLPENVAWLVVVFKTFLRQFCGVNVVEHLSHIIVGGSGHGGDLDTIHVLLTPAPIGLCIRSLVAR